MSEVLTEIIVDCSTGVAAEIPLTAEKLAQRELDIQATMEAQAAAEAEAATIAAAKTSAQEKLTALGLTAEEIAALSK
jgi:hypothetical protein